MSTPSYETVFDVEDKLRRNHNEEKLLRWQHEQLMKAMGDDPKRPLKDRIAVRSRYYAKKFWRTLTRWFKNRKDKQR